MEGDDIWGGESAIILILLTVVSLEGADAFRFFDISDAIVQSLIHVFFAVPAIYVQVTFCREP